MKKIYGPDSDGDYWEGSTWDKWIILGIGLLIVGSVCACGVYERQPSREELFSWDYWTENSEEYDARKRDKYIADRTRFIRSYYGNFLKR